MEESTRQKIAWVGIALIVLAFIYFIVNKIKRSKHLLEVASEKQSESSFRGGGGMGRRGGFFHGGRGRWGGGYGYGYPYAIPYPYYDDEPVVVVNSTKCPKGWIWMGAMLGCQKPQGI